MGESQLLNKLDVNEVELVLSVPNTNLSAKNETVNATVKVNKAPKKILFLLHENKNATYDEIAKQLDVVKRKPAKN